MKRKNIVIFGFIVLFSLYVLTKGLLIPVDSKEVNFGTNYSAFPPCPKNFYVRSEDYNYKFEYFRNFTLFMNRTLKTNVLLKGPAGNYFCTPNGVLIYAYYPGDEYLGVNAVFFDYNLSPKWKRHLPGVPYKNTPNGLILVSNPIFASSGKACAYVFNISTGQLITQFCPDVPGGHISHLKITRDKIYITLGAPLKSPPKTQALIYMKSGGRIEKEEITEIEGEGVGIRLLIDANGEHVAVAYFLANERGEEKSGVCVFTARNLKKIDCKELGDNETPLEVKLQGNTVYVQTTKGVKAYRILSLW